RQGCRRARPGGPRLSSPGRIGVHRGVTRGERHAPPAPLRPADDAMSGVDALSRRPGVGLVVDWFESARGVAAGVIRRWPAATSASLALALLVCAIALGHPVYQNN